MRLSASKLDLGALCLHWTTLELPPDVSGRAAVLGTAFHELAATGSHKQILSPEEAALTATRYAGWQKNGSKRLPVNRRHEVAFAINSAGRVRELGTELDRDYGKLDDDEIPGSIDAYGEGRAIDFKTGSRRIDAILSGQLGFASAATDSPVVEFHYVSETGRTTVDIATVSPVDALKAVSRVALRIVEGEVQPISGDHCYDLFCPARTVCSKYPYRKTNTTTSNPMPNMLAAVTKGRVKRPLKLLTFGMEGIGKSTFASQAPDPIFLCAEDGTSQLDVARFPEPKAWSDVMACVNELADDEHSFKTLVIDSLDWLQPLMIRHVCDEQKWVNEEKYHSFGLGEKFAITNWKQLIVALDRLREKRNVHVVILAHSMIAPFRNPEGEDFDRYQLALPNKSAELWKQWADVLLFMGWETLTKGEKRQKGILGDRFLYAERTAAFDSKNRFGISAPIPIPDVNTMWQAFSHAVKQAQQLNQPNQPANTKPTNPEKAA